MTELTSAVREAQADADRRFGQGPVQPWEPPPVLSDATRRRLAIVAVACALATATLVAIAVARPAPGTGSAPVAMEPPVPAAASDDEAPVDAAPLPAPIAPAAAPGLALERHGAEWHLSSLGAARHEVMQRLAEASGATVHGWPDAQAATRPLQLHWQGRSLAQLWPVVLGPELNFALQCRRERCDVWILGTARPDAVAPNARSLPPLSSDVFESSTPPLPMPGSDPDGTPIRD